MPVKNTAQFLPECIDSILAQSFESWELIAVNDHSEDESAAILETYAKKDSRIKVLQNNGHGIIPAMQIAFQHSTGKYISRMDSDDICKPNKLAVLRQNLVEAGKGHIALASVEYFSANALGEGYQKYSAWLNKLSETGSNFQEIYKECTIPSPCWMLHKEDLQAAGAFDSDTYPEDYDLCFRIYAAGIKCIPCAEVLHKWRDYPNRTSRIDPNYADNHFSELKIHYFLKLHKEDSKNLVLWGAGKRAKKIAILLQKAKLHFTWICNNPNKIGVTIYGQILQQDKLIETIEKPQIIVAISNVQDQLDIVQRLKGKGFKNMEDYFFFC